MFALSFNECVAAIAATGTHVTTLIQGEMGCGKSSILKELAKRFPDHTPCYFDCTTKDLGDLMLPKIGTLTDGEDFVRFVPNEELGLHYGKPVIIMIDELGKNKAVQNAMMRLMLERKLGAISLHPDSSVFATSNLGLEGVGDMLLPHHRNRISVVEMRKPYALEWIEWTYTVGTIHAAVTAWVHEYGSVLFQSFRDVTNPSDNPYINHPKEPRPACVTPRSLELASHWCHAYSDGAITMNVLKAALMGTLGMRGGADLAAYVALSDQLPTKIEIAASPLTARVPDSASAVMMTVQRTLNTLDREFMTPWMQYLTRLPLESQAVFINTVMKPTNKNFELATTHRAVTEWCMANTHLYAIDR